MSERKELIPLTAIILTQNEEMNIFACLAALDQVDDVVIVDSGSTDDTLQVAMLARSNVRIFQHPFVDFGDQRNWAIDHTEPRHQWLLFVDADEFCDIALMDEIRAFLQSPKSFVGGYIAGRNYFLGSWIKRSTLFPSYQLRILKRGEVRFRKEGHGQREVTEGELRFFAAGWRHEAFSKGVAQWVERHNRYSTDEAERLASLCVEKIRWGDVAAGRMARRRLLRQLAFFVPFRPLVRFLFSYVIRGGFLDGRAGLQFCLLLLSHHLIISVKLAELRARDEEAR